MFKSFAVFLLALAATNAQTPSDFHHYHYLHVARAPPRAPARLAYTPARLSPGFCAGRSRGYYADVDSGCQAYHLCWRQHLVSTDLCPDGTLFNEQFQVCDHFYNVRCGSPLEDL